MLVFGGKLVPIVATADNRRQTGVGLTLRARGSTLVVRILTTNVDPPHFRPNSKNIYNNRRPITWVFKRGGKS